MVYSIPIYNVGGDKIKDIELNNQIFNDENINEGLIHEFVLMQLANKRNPIAHCKNRGEVNYAGRKLYKQKGTGRARAGNAGSPTRRHGGVAFGPRNTVNYTKFMNKKAKKKALFGSLTLKARDQEIIGLESFIYQENKTKNAFNIIKNLKLEQSTILLIIPNLQLIKSENYLVNSFKNISNVKTLVVDFINPYDLLTYKKIIFLEETIDNLSKIFIQ